MIVNLFILLISMSNTSELHKLEIADGALFRFQENFHPYLLKTYGYLGQAIIDNKPKEFTTVHVTEEMDKNTIRTLNKQVTKPLKNTL